MKTEIQLQATKLPKLLSELTHSNQFLKVFSISSVVVSTLALILSFILFDKEPVILTITTEAAALETGSLPKPEIEIRTAIRKYLEKRYKWTPNNVKKNLEEAQIFILPASLSAYQSAGTDVARFSVEKVVTQQVYPEKIDVNLDKKTAFITGDRVTSIQGLKAAGDLRLEISFDSGPRTKENPWGVYIVKEREAQ
jgi:hypothetical protein